MKKTLALLALLVAVVAAFAADGVDFSDVTPAKPTQGRIESRMLDFDNNQFVIFLSYTSGGERKAMSVQIKASEIIAEASNPQMGPCLVELRTVLNTLTKAKAKAKLEQ